MITLSVLIISHNQKELLQRCIESVLQQDLPFDHEIIISDDASTDGTFELAQEYANKYIEISAYSCNSNDCNPTYSSERSGHNRSNAYQHATGKYFCHIDADDFYRPGTDCLKRMVELLESHPDCSICMQNGWIINSDDSLENGYAFYPEHRFTTGKILNPKDYFKSGLFVNNGAMMMRRNTAVNPGKLYHKWYVDSVITNHHLQFGNIICIDCADWVYVNYPKSITSSLSPKEQTIVWNLDLTVFSAMLVPKFTKLYYSKGNILGLKDAANCILERASISNTIHFFLEQFSNVFVYHCAAKNGELSFLEKFRLHIITAYSNLLLKSHSYGSAATLVLHKLCGGKPYNPTV